MKLSKKIEFLKIHYFFSLWFTFSFWVLPFFLLTVKSLQSLLFKNFIACLLLKVLLLYCKVLALDRCPIKSFTWSIGVLCNNSVIKVALKECVLLFFSSMLDAFFRRVFHSKSKKSLLKVFSRSLWEVNKGWFSFLF